MVFGSGNRLLDKQLATQGKARPALARACWHAQSSSKLGRPHLQVLVGLLACTAVKYASQAPKKI